MLSPLRHCQEIDAPTSALEQALCSGNHLLWQEGLTPDTLQMNLARDPVIIVVILAMIAAMMFNFSHCRRIFKNMPQNLWGVRQRENAFDEQPPYERRTSIMMTMQLLVCETILMYLYFMPAGISESIKQTNITLGILFGLILSYHLFQLAAYTIVGWVFAGINGTRLWIKGFNASSGVLGLLLLVPAIAAIFYPAATVTMITISLFFYFLARIIFIFKGFRIFYYNLFSLIYFILYLCTLEIIPIILIYTEAGILCKFKF